MTKEITKSYILQQMQDKFGLREYEPEVFTFGERVIPVYNIEQHLGVWESFYGTLFVDGTGPLSALLVAEDERITLRAYAVVFLTGVYTVAGAYIYRAHHRDENDFSYLDLTAGQSTSYLRTLPEAVVLEPGDELFLNIDGYTSVGNVRFYYDFMRETLR